MILPRNRFFSIGSGSPRPERPQPRLDLDDLTFLHAEGVVKRHVRFGGQPAQVAQLDHRFVGPHAFAGVLLAAEHDSVERSEDRVLLERPLGQRQLGLGDRRGSPALP